MPDGDAVADLNLPVVAGEGGGEGEGDGSAAVEDTGEKTGGGAEQSKAAGEPPKKTEPKPFLLSEGLPPVPAKLVGRILKGNFIDMAELLRDNLEAERRGVFQDSAGSSSSSHGRTRREVPDLLSWVQCFGLYTAVVGSQHPDRALKLLAYQTLIVREARRCGGRGWLTYDTVFRQQMAGEWKGDEWGRLNPYLYSSTFLTLGSSRLNCPLCLESDHREEDCALAKGKGVGTSRQPGRDPYSREGSGRQPKSKTPRVMACFAWNQGECSFQFCRFKHICVRCGGDHKITVCRAGGTQDKRPSRDKDSKASGEAQHP